MDTKQYSIDELKSVLFQKINDLIEIDSYWNKCVYCQNQGKCCINADISIREDEWLIIKDYIHNLNTHDKHDLKNNIENRVFCPFRTSNKCLIHEVRPLNCIWTPFQVVQNINSGDIIYSMIDNECNFQTITIKNQPMIDINSQFIKLPSYNKEYFYLFLNKFFINYENNSRYTYKTISELLTEVLSMIC